jgi:hypothetical protein
LSPDQELDQSTDDDDDYNANDDKDKETRAKKPKLVTTQTKVVTKRKPSRWSNCLRNPKKPASKVKRRLQKISYKPAARRQVRIQSSDDTDEEKSQISHTSQSNMLGDSSDSEVDPH